MAFKSEVLEGHLLRISPSLNLSKASYLVTIVTDHHLTYLKMRARDKRTANESFKCCCFIVLWSTQKNLRRGWQPKAPLPNLVRPRVNILAASLDVNIQGSQWQPIYVHLWDDCNPPIAQGNDVWCQHHRGNLPYSFWTVMWVSIWLMKKNKEGWRRRGQWLIVTNDAISPIIWTATTSQPVWSHQLFGS